VHVGKITRPPMVFSLNVASSLWHLRVSALGAAYFCRLRPRNTTVAMSISVLVFSGSIYFVQRVHFGGKTYKLSGTTNHVNAILHDNANHLSGQ
jgi:multisubunit Na+/H+ antiporter MnhB subunit